MKNMLSKCSSRMCSTCIVSCYSTLGALYIETPISMGVYSDKSPAHGKIAKKMTV